MIYRVLLSILSVFLFRLSFPEGPAPLLAFVCLVPLGLALQGVNARRGLFLGMIYGFGGWLLSVWWIATGLVHRNGFPEPAAWFWTALFCFITALPYGLFGLLHGLFRWRSEGLADAFRSAACLTLLIVWYPHILPGSHVHALYEYPLFTQVLDLGGVPLLLFLLNLINWMLVGLILRIQEKSPLGPTLIALTFVLGSMTGYGAYRLGELHRQMDGADSRQIIRIASIQPNIGIPQQRSGASRREIATLYQKLIGLPQEARDAYPAAELAAWPEVPWGIPCDCKEANIEKVVGTVRGTGIPLVLSCFSWGKEGGATRYYNAAMLIDPAGACGPVYQKRILFPFGEYLPLEEQFPVLRTIFPGSSDYTHGTQTVLFELPGGKRIIPTICYEVVFPDLIRRSVREGGNVLLNLSDDIWFGESDASAIHLALGIYRSIEYRLPLVRVTNSGNGVFVQPTGEIAAGSRTPISRQAMTSYPLFIPRGQSLYHRIGDGFLWLLSILWLIDAATMAALRRRRPPNIP